MKKQALVLIILIISINFVSAQLADSPWPKFRGNLKNTGLSPFDTSHVDGTVKWAFETGAGIESSPAIGPDGTIYIGSHDNKLYAVNPDGTEKWNFLAGDPVYDDIYDIWKGILSTPAIAEDGTIYFSSLSDYFFALNPDGTEKWRFRMAITSDTWTSPIIGPDGTIYTGSAGRYLEGTREDRSLPGGRLYALNSDGTEKWCFLVDSDICPTPALGDDGTLYFGSGGDHKFWAVDSSGNKKWHFNTGKHIETSAAIAGDGTIYFGAWDNYFYALNPDGTEKWRFKTDGDGLVSSAAIGSDGTIYFAANDNYFYSLTPDGEEKWRFKLGEGKEEGASPTIGSDGTIYIGASYSSAEEEALFYAFNPSGTVKWSYSMDGGVVGSPAIGSDGTVYVGSWDYKLYAFGGPKEAQNGTPKEETLSVEKEQLVKEESASSVQAPLEDLAPPDSEEKQLSFFQIILNWFMSLFSGLFK